MFKKFLLTQLGRFQYQSVGLCLSVFQATQDLLRTLRARSSELDDWTNDLAADLRGLPEQVRAALDHATRLDEQAQRLER